MGDDGVEGDGFWLPPEFFTDDDFLIEKENFKRNNTFCFPYRETLSHHGRSFGGSSNGSPTPFSSSLTPSAAGTDPIGDLIYLAAGQVAKLKLSGSHGFEIGPGPTKGFQGPRRSSAQLSTSVYQNTHIPGRGMALGEMGRAAWALHQNPTRVGSGLNGGSGAVKRKCAGTGVFLPRRYGSNDVDRNVHSSNSRKRPDTTAAVRACTKNFDSSTGFNPSRPVPLPHVNNALIQDYELLMARRHAIMLQHRQNLLLLEGSPMICRDMYLSQEWSY